MNQHTLNALLEARAIREAVLIAHGSRIHLEVATAGNRQTLVTGKGEPRQWKTFDAALKWSRTQGLGHVRCELTHWQPGQQALL